MSGNGEVTSGTYYVYVYRDPHTNAIRYVGKGKARRVDAVVGDVYRVGDPDRRAELLQNTDKKQVRLWFAKLERQGYAPVVELMPCQSEPEAFAVEAALISALWGTPDLLNAVHGHHGRFGPLGLPEDLARRRFDSRLTREELTQDGGALVVYISPRSFFGDDSRPGAAPRLPLSDSARKRVRNYTVQRVTKYWQLGDARIECWKDDPEASPALLLGVTGPPTGRWIWAAMEINRPQWKAAKRHPGGLWEVPVFRNQSVVDTDLDAGSLRGRYLTAGAVGPVINADGSRRFGAISSQFFDIVTDLAA